MLPAVSISGSTFSAGIIHPLAAKSQPWPWLVAQPCTEPAQGPSRHRASQGGQKGAAIVGALHEP